MDITKNYLAVMENIAKKNAKMMSESLEEALYNAMTSLNVGMISFALNGNDCYFDVPKIYATIEDDVDTTGNEYCVKEIIAVIANGGRIYIVPDSKYVTDELLNELESWTHYTRQDVPKLKDLQWCSIRVTNNFNLLNTNDTMFKVFKSCSEALMSIKEPLERTINISEL